MCECLTQQLQFGHSGATAGELGRAFGVATGLGPQSQRQSQRSRSQPPAQQQPVQVSDEVFVRIQSESFVVWRVTEWFVSEQGGDQQRGGAGEDDEGDSSDDDDELELAMAISLSLSVPQPTSTAATAAAAGSPSPAPSAPQQVVPVLVFHFLV